MFAITIIAAAPGLSTAVLDAGSMGQEYPTWALLAGKSAGSVVELWTDPVGRIYDCKILGTVGDERLANQICDLVVRRRAKPATSADGERAYGSQMTMLSLTIPRTKQGREVGAQTLRPDGVISVAQLPSGFCEATTINLAVHVDVNGRIMDCAAQDDVPASLGEIACRTFADESMAVGLDASGKAVNYVTNLRVRFSQDEQG
jgi:hypothetical protein